MMQEAAQRKREKSEVNTSLTAYFHDLSSHGLLTHEQERQALQDIEEREILVWQQMLSHAPAVDAVLRLLEESLSDAGTPLECPAETREAWETDVRALRRAVARAKKAGDEVSRARLNKTAQKVAEHLRVFDVDRQVAERLIGRLSSIRPKKDAGYLSRVAAAQRAAMAAREAFIRKNLRLVVAIARRYRRDLLPLSDLIQEGNIGLIKGLARFDSRRGVKFSTYASWWIRHSLNRALAEKGREVRIPVHMLETQYKVGKAERDLNRQFGRESTVGELAEKSQISPERIERMRSHVRDHTVSLDATVDQSDERTLQDMFRDPHAEDRSALDQLAEQELLGKLGDLLSEVLQPIEANILRWRFGLDDDHELKLKEIGERYQLSRERIRQLQEQALTKLRLALVRRKMM